MPKKTPHYDLTFYQFADRYSASDDLDRMVVIDNQLETLSRVVGDGVLTGWTVSLDPGGGLTINVSPGSGFIGKVLHKTLTIKSADVVDDATNSVLLQSRFLSDPGSFKVEVESPSSATVSDTFVDTTPPSAPTGFIGTAIGFDLINLFWDANTELDFRNYQIDRDTSAAFPSPTSIGTPTQNGIFPNDPLQDSGLDSDTDYFYRIRAVDDSGNASPYAVIGPITTLADTRLPGDPTNLRLFPSNGQISAVFDPSTSTDVTKYIVTVEELAADGSVSSSSEIDNGLVETVQITGLTNGLTYRVRVQSVRMPDATEIRSTGIEADSNPALISGPLSVTSLTATPGIGSVTLSWTASASASGSAVGQKDTYRIVVSTTGEDDSSPIDVGLVTTKTLNSYNDAAAVGVGPVRFFEDDTVYLFKVFTLDSFGNESGPVLVKSTTSDATVPKNPRGFQGTAGDESAELLWRHSQSLDVVDYEIFKDEGSGFVPAVGVDGLVGYVEEFVVTGLTNGTVTTFRIKAKDDAGNFSSGVNTVVVPQADTVPPAIPTRLRASPGDEHVRLTWEPVADEDFSHFLVERSAIEQDIDVDPNAELTVIPGSTVTLNVGDEVLLSDIGLTNGQTYRYRVRSVDLRGNQSDFTGNVIVVPSEGLNTGPDRLEAPQNPDATFSSSPSKITVTWDYDFFGAVLVGSVYTYTVNPTAAPTAFNIYRSTDPIVGFELVASVDSGLRSYIDTLLQNGEEYFYRVTAVRDTANVIVDTGSVQPPNTLFLATVTASGGSITSIENSQRIADNLESTLTEETLSRLLVHRHLTKPINNVSVDTVRTLSLIDINDLSTIDITDLNLSTAARSYFSTVDKDPSTGEVDIFDDNTIYIFSPNNIVNNVPFIGDFQLLVNGERPSSEFTIDESINAVVFAAPLQDTDQVVVDGLGLTFYVPVKLDNPGDVGGASSVEITLNGSLSSDALIDKDLQTIRYLTARADSDVVQVEVETLVPDFGTRTGARQVSLSPRITLNDFDQINDRTFTSRSGTFEDGDNVFVLVDGVPTTLSYVIDFEQKSIIFDDPVSSTSQVSLRIRDREEVQDELPARRISGVEASSFRTGEFIKPQLPDLSHEGRVRERAFPIFSPTSTSNNYVYAAPEGTVGSATTPYAVTQVQSGEVLTFLLGTSRGLLRSVKNVFIGSGDDASVIEDLAGTEFESSDSPSQIASEARVSSGRVKGVINVTDGSGSVIFSTSNPNMVGLDDGRVLLVGGRDIGTGGNPVTARAFIYAPSTGLWTETGSLPAPRTDMATALLPNGNVLLSGGTINVTSSNRSFLFTTSSGTWSEVGPMITARSFHAMQVIDRSVLLSDVVAAGGSTFSLSGSDLVEEALTSAERYEQSPATWRTTGSLNFTASSQESFTDNGSVILDTFETREIYNASSETWIFTDPVLVRQSDLPFAELDGPIKQFFLDSTGALLAVTRNSVFESGDQGVTFSEMKGLETVGVVHKVSEVGGTLFAGTDLGVYEITSDIRANSTWFQGGLIGAGTTETFDLVPLDDEMVAATEIGVFASGDDGETWVELIDLENVFNIGAIGDSTLFAQSEQKLYRSNDAGANWAEVATLSFLTPNSKMVTREPTEIFFGTDTGLFVSTDGVSFSLLDFNINRNENRNNVHMVQAIGTDVYVSYDNQLFAVGPDRVATLIAEFTGTIPTVRLNGSEVRDGFRYDTEQNRIVFEIKRLSDDVVETTSNYFVYSLSGGGWYEQNPSAPVTVFVDRVIQDSGSLVTDPRLGQVSFEEARRKYEVVTLSIAGTTLKNEGELFHEELENKLELEKGLQLSLGRNYAADLLQLGLSIEHNFLERGLERNQYYCLTGTFVDRSFNSFWSNAEFFILGRRGFDMFNSTIDYKVEDEQDQVGPEALVPLASLEVTPVELWVGTDDGIFVLDPSSSFSVSETIQISEDERVPVRNLGFFSGDVIASTDQGIFLISDDGSGIEIEKNAGKGLPDSVFTTSIINNLLIAGTDDGIYFASSNENPPYGVWFRATFTELNSIAPISIQGTCRAMAVKDGTGFAAIGASLFSSTDGKKWEKIHEFQSSLGIVINRMTFFADVLFLGTNKGVYNDRGSSRSDLVDFDLELLEATEDASKIHINDLYAGTDTLFAASETGFVYSRKSEVWTKQNVPAPSVHEFIETSGGRRVAMTNNQVFVE